MVQSKQALVDGFRLNRGQDQVAGIKDEDGPRPSALGDIDEFFLDSGIFLQFSYGRGPGIDDGENAVDLDGIAKANINESAVHG